VSAASAEGKPAAGGQKRGFFGNVAHGIASIF
jgi:hypothetical protein